MTAGTIAIIRRLNILMQYFDGLKNFNHALCKRIQIALDEVIRIYGEDDIVFDFSPEYRTIPKRMKGTRNALNHGNCTY